MTNSRALDQPPSVCPQGDTSTHDVLVSGLEESHHLGFLQPMPEEMERSYLGRMMRYNGLASVKSLLETATWQLARRDLEVIGVPTSDVAAAMSGTSSEYFVCSHTLTPLRRAVTSNAPEIAHGSSLRKSLYSRGSGPSMRDSAHFCAKCVCEDLEFHGLTYWRRDWQIPGQHWCSVHGAELHTVRRQEAFLFSPAQFLESSTLGERAWVSDARESYIVQRFIQIAAACLQFNRPIDHKHARLVLRERAVQCGFYLGKAKGHPQVLSSEILSLVPQQWLAEVAPSLVREHRGRRTPSIEGMLNGLAQPSLYYLLVAAVVFDSPDEALNALQSASVSLTDDGRALGTERKTVARANGIEEYVKSGGRYGEIARATSQSRHNLAYTYRRNGFPNLDTPNGRKLHAGLTCFLVEGLSLIDSAHRSGARLEELESCLRGVASEARDIVRRVGRVRVAQCKTGRIN